MAIPQNTRELIREEYKKCLVDPIYFIRKHCLIQHPVRGRITFDLFTYQEDSINALQTHNRIITLKARQLGFSTVVACYSVWLSLFHKDKSTLVVATKESTAQNIITKAKFAYDNLPAYLKVPLTKKNTTKLEFKNGSSIKAISSNPEAARSEAISFLILDEAAFIEAAEDVWAAAQTTLATGGNAIVISTPNGIGGFFHKTWIDAELGVNDFHPIKLTWEVHPDRDAAWAEKELKSLGPRKFSQEYEAEFLGSGNTVIDSEYISTYKELIKNTVPIKKSGFDGNLWIWQEVNYTTPYLVVADVARGDGSDFSAFHVLNAETVEQVAEYKGKVDTTLFGHMLVEIATTYNDALLVVENANPGWAVLQTIITRGYRNLFYLVEDIKVVDPRNIRWSKTEKRKKPGFTTSPTTRPLIVSKLEEYMRTQELKIKSPRLISEIETFIWHNGKAVAQSGYNDDLVMAMAIGLWIRDTSLQIFQHKDEITRKTLASISRGTAPIYVPRPVGDDPYQMPVTHHVPHAGNPYVQDGMEDFRWLLNLPPRKQ